MDLSSYTSVFRANVDDQRTISKRNRRPISCVACRAKKLKCDRQHPCGTCSKRGDEALCGFKTSTDLNGTNTASRRNEEKSRSEAQARLQRLEEMVNGLIQSGVAPFPGARNTNDVPNEMPRLSSEASSQARGASNSTRGNGETTYAGATHWAVILESIHGVRDILDADNDILSNPSPQVTSSDSVNVIFGSVQPISREEVLTTLPPRPVTDKLLSIYFNDKFVSVPFIHMPKFQREYEKFQNDPSSASFLWMSILFSTLSIASRVAAARGEFATVNQHHSNFSSLFSKRASQCLVAGNYFKSQPYTIEALLLYSHGRFIQNEDSDPALWSIFGFVTRLAQRLGYHRDPRHLSTKVTPFEGEIRRRVWLYISAFDLLFSFQLGMPAIIHEDQCDTDPPRNLLDEDFDESYPSLPLSRDATDATQMLYYGYKAGLIGLFRRIVRLALSVNRPKYEESIKLHNALQAAHEDCPPCLRIRPIRSSGFTDQTYTIMHRLILEILYCKSLCVLHRTYLSYDKENPKYKLSRETCPIAALKILDIQAEFYEESRPGGRLYEDRWMVTTLTLHDFLLAAMIVCLDLSHSPPSSPSEHLRKLTALQTSHTILSERRFISRDAAHAYGVLTAMLTKVSKQTPQQGDAYLPTSFPLTNNVALIETTIPSLQPQNTTVRFAISGMDTSNLEQSCSFRTKDLEPLDIVLNDPGNLDWNLIDQYLFDRHGGVDSGWDQLQ